MLKAAESKLCFSSGFRCCESMGRGACSMIKAVHGMMRRCNQLQEATKAANAAREAAQLRSKVVSAWKQLDLSYVSFRSHHVAVVS